jgi:hypothetical protein
MSRWMCRAQRYGGHRTSRSASGRCPEALDCVHGQSTTQWACRLPSWSARITDRAGPGQITWDGPGAAQRTVAMFSHVAPTDRDHNDMGRRPGDREGGMQTIESPGRSRHRGSIGDRGSPGVRLASPSRMCICARTHPAPAPVPKCRGDSQRSIARQALQSSARGLTLAERILRTNDPQNFWAGLTQRQRACRGGGRSTLVGHVEWRRSLVAARLNI